MISYLAINYAVIPNVFTKGLAKISDDTTDQSETDTLNYCFDHINRWSPHVTSPTLYDQFGFRL